MDFFLNIEPPTITAQEHKVAVRNGKPIFYDTPRLKQARDLLCLHLNRYAPEEMFTCGVRLDVEWHFPLGKSHKPGYKTTRPDTDNLQKLLKDCMTACGYWKDDALVADEHIQKFWSESPGIRITVESLEGEDEEYGYKE